MPTERIVYGLIALALVGVGYQIADWQWAAKWDRRDVADITLKQKLTDDYRAKEQALQGEIDGVRENAILALQGAASGAVAAAAVAAGVHDDAAELADSLAACTSESAKRSTASAKLLAELFRRADEVAGRMARIADESQIRGRACEQSYNNARGAK